MKAISNFKTVVSCKKLPEAVFLHSRLFASYLPITKTNVNALDVEETLWEIVRRDTRKDFLRLT